MPDSPFLSLFSEGGQPCLIEFPLEGLIESQGMETLHGQVW
jgi:hypothetical protein